MTSFDHRLACAVTLGVTTLLAGCSVVSPHPLWELVKGAGLVAGAVASTAQPRASLTLRQTDEVPGSVCIEYNPLTEVDDFVPALQLELRMHQVDSRVYESAQQVASCRYWLRYSAWIDWDTPPLSSTYRSYVKRASLLLQTAGGQVLSQSHYVAEGTLRTSRWSSTRDKLAPVVTALLTGVETAEVAACPSHSLQLPQEFNDDPASCVR